MTTLTTRTDRLASVASEHGTQTPGSKDMLLLDFL